jgi:hypothetical protein
MLLAFQKPITWRWQSLYEAKVFYEVNGGATNNDFESMTFDELWNLDSTLLTFNVYFILLSTLIAFQNAKALLIWSIYVNLVVLQNLTTILERDPRFWRYVEDLYEFAYMICSMMNISYIILVSHILSQN